MKEKLKTAGVIRISSLGDVVLSTILVRFLIARNYHVIMFSSPLYEDLFKHQDGVDFIPVSRHNLKNLRDNFPVKMDVLYDIHDNFLSRKIRSTLSEKSERTIIWKPMRLKRWLFVITRLKMFSPPHVLERFCREGFHQGFTPMINIPDKLVKEIISELKVETFSEPVVTICPSSRWKSKRYSLTNYVAVAKKLQSSGIKVIFLFGKDFNMGHILSSEKFHAIENPGLDKAACILKKSSLVISNDTGLAHLSEAVGTPVLMIYTSTAPELGYTPFLKDSRWVYSHLFCSPCSPHGRNYCLFNLRCTKYPGVENIVNVAKSMLGL